MKQLVNLNGVKALSKKEQRNVNGGTLQTCNVDSDCTYPRTCQGCFCILPGDPV